MRAMHIDAFIQQSFKRSQICFQDEISYYHSATRDHVLDEMSVLPSRNGSRALVDKAAYKRTPFPVAAVCELKTGSVQVNMWTLFHLHQL